VDGSCRCIRPTCSSNFLAVFISITNIRGYPFALDSPSSVIWFNVLVVFMYVQTGEEGAVEFP
jgi:hypothetical protein